MQIQTDKLMELGSLLKEKRRELGLEREEIAIKIKVAAKTLHALEEAIPDSLPQPVFAKGFARSYAQALGLDMEVLNALIAEAFPMDFKDNVKPELSSASREQSITINQTSNAKLLVFVVPLLLIILGLAGWFLFKAFMAGDDQVAPASRQISQAGQVRPVSAAPQGSSAQPAPAVPPAEPAEPVEGAAASPASAPAPQPAAAPAQPVSPPSAPPAGAPSAQPEAARQPTDFPPNQVPQSNARADSPIPSGMHRVVLFAKYECWVGAEFDGAGRRSFTLEAGQTFVLDFKQKLTLTLGNSGAIDMSFNGQPYEIGGRFREAKVLVFPPQ